MKNIIIVLGLLVGTSTQLQAAPSAGTGDSGGGMAVVCRDQAGNITKPVELLDLWEARVRFKRTLVKSNASVETQVQSAIANLRYSFPPMDKFEYDRNGVVHTGYDAIGFNLYDAVRTYRGVAEPLHEYSPAPTNDAEIEGHPAKGCEIEQVVVYKSMEPYYQALVNQDLVDKMDNTHRAALELHEAYYQLLRFYHKEKTSVRTRRMIGLAFSGYKFTSLDSMLPQKHYRCESHGTRVYLYARKNETAMGPEPYRLEVQVESILVGENVVPALGMEKNPRGFIPLTQKEKFFDVIRGFQDNILFGNSLGYDSYVSIKYDDLQATSYTLKIKLERAAGVDVTNAEELLVPCQWIDGSK